MNAGQSSNPEYRPPADGGQRGDGGRAAAQPALFARLPGLAQRWRDGAIDDACYAAMYFLYGQLATHGRRYASRRRKADPRPDAAQRQVMQGGQCAIYKSLKKSDHYLYVEKQGDFSRVPAPLLQLLGSLEWVMDLELGPGRKLASADAAEVRRQLEEQGYYLQLPPKKF